MDAGLDVVGRLRAAGCVFAADEARLLGLAAGTPAQLETMVRQRVAGLPLEVILGYAEFHGLRIDVDAGVFVPRRRTEFLVDQAAALAPEHPLILDICCGSGAIGAALMATLDRVELYAVDIDPASVQCARRNVEPGGGRVFEGDLYDPLPGRLRGQVDLVVANAPYVPSDSIALMSREARIHEPRVALDGGPHGIDVQRAVTAGAPRWLAPGGALIIETSDQQAPQTAEFFTRNGLIPRIVSDDELGATVVIGTRWPAAASAPKSTGSDGSGA
jgi:release factor glutamine methyltransferase